MSRRSSGTWLRLCLVIFAVVSALAVCGPALYWRFKKTLRFVDSKSSCPPCICDCPPPLSLLKIAHNMINGDTQIVEAMTPISRKRWRSNLWTF
ncbi:hypothetical protein Gotur_006098 [Gossypium turneri]